MSRPGRAGRIIIPGDLLRQWLHLPDWMEMGPARYDSVAEELTLAITGRWCPEVALGAGRIDQLPLLEPVYKVTEAGDVHLVEVSGIDS